MDKVELFSYELELPGCQFYQSGEFSDYDECIASLKETCEAYGIEYNNDVGTVRSRFV